MKKLLIIATAIFFIASPSFEANAQLTLNPVLVENNDPLNVVYIGTEDNYLVFRVEIKTGDVNYSVLKIDDATEGELYSKAFNTNSKFQTMKIEKRENQVLDFKLVWGKTMYVRTFVTGNNFIEEKEFYQRKVATL